MCVSVRFRLLLLVAALGLGSLILPRPVSACEVCKYTFGLGYAPCRPVGDGEVGTTICTNSYDPFGGFSCDQGGDYCSAITVTPGGGGAAGGGNDGGACRTSGFCPSQCFSCSGGGGRPAV
jgi:hypothetical protein